MFDEIHIIPSGSDKTLCGLNAKYVKGSSLGLGNDCKACDKIAQQLINKEKRKQDSKRKSK